MNYYLKNFLYILYDICVISISLVGCLVVCQQEMKAAIAATGSLFRAWCLWKK